MVDSSYASHSDRKSQYGISVHMNSKSGSWISISKKGTILALSSTEAEYIAIKHLKSSCGDDNSYMNLVTYNSL